MHRPRPQRSAYLVAGNEFAGALQQQLEDKEGLFLEKDRTAVAVQFAGFQIKFEWAEGGDLARRGGSHKGR